MLIIFYYRRVVYNDNLWTNYPIWKFLFYFTAYYGGDLTIWNLSGKNFCFKFKFTNSKFFGNFFFKILLYYCPEKLCFIIIRLWRKLSRQALVLSQNVVFGQNLAKQKHIDRKKMSQIKKKRNFKLVNLNFRFKTNFCLINFK